MLLFFGFEVCGPLFFWGWKFEACYFLGVGRKYPQMSMPVRIYAECPLPGNEIIRAVEILEGCTQCGIITP